MIKPSKSLLNLDNAACTDFLHDCKWVIAPDCKGPEELFCYCLNLTKFLFRCYFLKLIEEAQSFSVVSLFRATGEGIYPWGSALCAQPVRCLFLSLLLRSLAVQLNEDLTGLNSKDRWCMPETSGGPWGKSTPAWEENTPVSADRTLGPALATTRMYLHPI